MCGGMTQTDALRPLRRFSTHLLADGTKPEPQRRPANSASGSPAGLFFLRQQQPQVTGCQTSVD
jgi:hypothetical protein